MSCSCPPRDVLVGDNHVILVRENIGRDWRDLGHRLGITSDTLDVIQIDYHAYGAREMANQTIGLWMKNNEKPKLHVLLQVLAAMGRKDICGKLKDDPSDSKTPNPSDKEESKTGSDELTGDQKILPRHKRHVCVHLDGESWRFLGEELGFLPARLDVILENSKGVQEACRKTLEEWMGKETRTLGQLKQALIDIKCNGDILKELN